MRRIISICKEVPLLPIAIIAAIPLALLVRGVRGRLRASR